MNKFKFIMVFAFSLFSCNSDLNNYEKPFLVNEIPADMPIEFKQIIVPDDKLIHKGIFSPDLKSLYYTLSDKNFENFDVYVMCREGKMWSKPEKAFFNTKYNEHGMSFSPNGDALYFSSTRPINVDDIDLTWHIWKSENSNGKWQEPKFVDIPNLRGKLMSHPTIANSGTLYFHSSNLDYSDMDIYSAKQIDGKFIEAEKVLIENDSKNAKSTPFVSPKEDFLIFASVENQLNLKVTFNDGAGKWTNTKAFSDSINSFGQGNPYVTPSNKYLFFTTGKSNNDWKIKWVDIESEIRGN
ncbi:hypothetical protein Q2T40_11065 [Winogradskyella maritima]|uniref:WD40 repeat protein n=1 Tax=Winogradskyella maritima TaxID=1517766 RepID=A0ABV8AJZ1_9FLAO|nr:hypothetical protein [Winogradskyella maritima]